MKEDAPRVIKIPASHKKLFKTVHFLYFFGNKYL